MIVPNKQVSKSTTRFRHRMQCRNCEWIYRKNLKLKTGKWFPRGFFTLKKSPEKYFHDVRCPTCKSTNVVSIEKHRINQREKQDTCYCQPIPFPHNKGGMRFCVYHPLYETEPTDDEWKDYQSLLGQKRGGRNR